MEEEVLKKYKQAHDISDGVIDLAKGLVKEGAKIFDLAETIEKEIVEKGAVPSWPVNFSINEIAAHITPRMNDDTVLKEEDLVKVDIGCQVDGYISDRAFTVCIGSKTHPLIETSKKATEAALNALKPGVKVCEISEIIDSVVTDAGFNPIRNLAGHSMGQYSQHEPPSIPNSKTNDEMEIAEGTPIAIEVFTTTGSGWVKESSPNVMFKFLEDKAVRLPEARKILNMSMNQFQGLPFTQRWLEDISPIKVNMALKQLVDVEALEIFPPLKEESNAPVAVWEDTKIVL